MGRRSNNDQSWKMLYRGEALDQNEVVNLVGKLDRENARLQHVIELREQELGKAIESFDLRKLALEYAITVGINPGENPIPLARGIEAYLSAKVQLADGEKGSPDDFSPEEDDAPVDDRITAWHAIAQHPFFKECYLVEGALLSAMLSKLDRVGDTSGLQQTIDELREQLREIREAGPYQSGYKAGFNSGINNALRVARNYGLLDGFGLAEIQRVVDSLKH